MSLERPRCRTARGRLQYRCLQLKETAVFQKPPNMRHDSRPEQQSRPGFRVNDDIEVALTIDLLRVAQPVPLLGQRPQRLRQQDAAVDLNRDLARLGDKKCPLGTDDIAEI